MFAKKKISLWFHIIGRKPLQQNTEMLFFIGFHFLSKLKWFPTHSALASKNEFSEL